MKRFKRLLYFLGAFFGLLILAALILPRFFKDDIRAAIDAEIAKNIDATVYYDADAISVSLFANFPNLTASLASVGVVGKGVFEGDTLLSVGALDLEIDLMGLFKGDVTLTGLNMDQADIFLMVLEDGTANYDIMVPGEPSEGDEAEAPLEEEESMLVAIDHWNITNSRFVYYDLKYVTFMNLEGLDLKGSGDLTSDRFDLATEAHIGQVGFIYDEVAYMNGQAVDANVVLDMNYMDYTFRFKENSLRVNDFGMHFDGYFGMPEEGYDLDLSFVTEQNSFKSLLSLVPGMYQEDFAGLTADGNVQFDGELKGFYAFDGSQMPAYRINLRVDEGNFQYPDLPSGINDVNLHLLVESPDGTEEATIVDLQRLSLNLGANNPITAKARIEGLAKMQVNADVTAKVNLADFAKAIPMDGVSLAGQLALEAHANGTYDEATEQIPAFDTKVTLSNGRVQYSEYPLPLENMAMQLTAQNRSGTLAATTVNLQNFAMQLDGEPFTASGTLTNLADYTWDARVQGGVDLAKVMGVLNMGEMPLKGHLTMDLSTAGKMSALEAEQYDQLPTSGTLLVEKFEYAGSEVPAPVQISKGDFSFNPRMASLNTLQMQIGNSDLRLSGDVTNYLAYALNGDLLKGTLNLYSTRLDLNQLMASDASTAEDDAPESDTATAELEVIEVPRNLDLIVKSQIGEVLYENLDMKDVRGDIMVRDGQVILNGLRFKALEGNFAISGAYDTRDMEHPKADFDLNIQEISIPQAYRTFGVVKRLAPIAEKMQGKMSTDFSLSTELTQNMMPDYGTLSGSGLLRIAEAMLEGSPLVQGVTEVTKLKDTNGTVNFRNVVMAASIKDGRLNVDPFDVKLFGYTSTIAGSTGLDGSIDYVVGLQVPTGAAGDAFNSLVSGYLGGNALTDGTVNLNVGMGGTYNDPTFQLASATSGGGSVRQSVTTAVTQQANQQVQAATEQVVQTAEEKKAELAEQARLEAEKAKAEAEERLRQEAEKAKEEAAQRVRNLLRRGSGGGGGR